MRKGIVLGGMIFGVSKVGIECDVISRGTRSGIISGGMRSGRRLLYVEKGESIYSEERTTEADGRLYNIF